MDTYADGLAKVIQALDLRDVVLAGHSTGGGEVTRYTNVLEFINARLSSPKSPVEHGPRRTFRQSASRESRSETDPWSSAHEHHGERAAAAVAERGWRRAVTAFGGRRRGRTASMSDGCEAAETRYGQNADQHKEVVRGRRRRRRAAVCRHGRAAHGRSS
jgi:pimeloyl-ACP methyl ester carboxylesterase